MSDYKILVFIGLGVVVALLEKNILSTKSFLDLFIQYCWCFILLLMILFPFNSTTNTNFKKNQKVTLDTFLGLSDLVALSFGVNSTNNDSQTTKRRQKELFTVYSWSY